MANEKDLSVQKPVQKPNPSDPLVKKPDPMDWQDKPMDKTVEPKYEPKTNQGLRGTATFTDNGSLRAELIAAGCDPEKAKSIADRMCDKPKA